MATVLEKLPLQRSIYVTTSFPHKLSIIYNQINIEGGWFG